METKRLLLNRGQCNICHEIIISYYRHQMQWCSCHQAAVDGGVLYQRLVGDVTSLAVYSDVPFEEARKAFYRNGYGQNGQDAYRSTFLYDMQEDYLQALLSYPIPEWQLSLVKQEIEYRKEHNIVITDTKNIVIHE